MEDPEKHNIMPLLLIVPSFLSPPEVKNSVKVRVCCHKYFSILSFNSLKKDNKSEILQK